MAVAVIAPMPGININFWQASSCRAWHMTCRPRSAACARTALHASSNGRMIRANDSCPSRSRRTCVAKAKAPPAPVHANLANLLVARRQISQRKTALQNQLSATGHNLVSRQIRARIKMADRHLFALNAEIRLILCASPTSSSATIS